MDLFNQKIAKSYFYYQHPQTLCDVKQKENENLEFVQGVNFEFIDSLKNNGRKCLSNFDDSCEEICNSKVFVDIATAGRHRGLNTSYIKHILFHQRKHGRNVELQNTDIALFKSARDVMRVSTLSTLLGLESDSLIGIETPRLFPTVIHSLTCCHAQMIDHVIVQTPDTFPQNLISRTG